MKKSMIMEDLFKWGVLTAIIAIAAPDMAMAQQDINDMVTTVTKEQLPVFPYVLSAICYVGGAFMMVSGALSLKKHAENPGGEPMSKGIARLLTGGAITAVPALTGIIQRSMIDSGVKADYTSFDVGF